MDNDITRNQRTIVYIFILIGIILISSGNILSFMDHSYFILVIFGLLFMVVATIIVLIIAYKNIKILKEEKQRGD